ncbi:hypothetical protein GCM10009836_66110 [Pseudonocardia ailaonensis]|uniref:SAM-dependent methyltransferase n=1 Tax=Pseudonocardia ailaonensis TaxID=367279 RepID=A0ABN2NMI9_9PSEU
MTTATDVRRFVLHRAADPAALLRAAVRRTRPGGLFAVVDVFADADPLVAEESNRLERLRDRGHRRTLTFGEIARLVEDSGATIEGVSTRDRPVGLATWLERAPSGARLEIGRRIDDELGGGPLTGLHPFRDDDGSVVLVRHRVTVVAWHP